MYTASYPNPAVDAVTLDGKNRTWTWAEYEQHEEELEANRYQPKHLEPRTEPRKLHGATKEQLELFELNPADYDLVEKWLKKLPRKRQREHFRRIYIREYQSVKDDGSIAFKCGNKQRKYANEYIREILNHRLDLVNQQYDFSVSWLELNRDRMEEFYSHKERLGMDDDELLITAESDITEIADSHKPRATELRAKLPFCLIAPKKLDEYAETLANLISIKQFQFIKKAAESEDAESRSNAIFLDLYKKQGEFCAEIGFPLRHWGRYQDGKILKPEQVDNALAEIACEKYWARTMKKAQKRQIEHIAIACGEVQKKVSPYISRGGLYEYQASVKKSWDFLQAMIIENVEDPQEQIELFETWKKSASNSEIRYKEMANRMRGIEEWSEENEMHCLFLTLTAPSAFHAMRHNGSQNPKWNGSSPHQTHQYLNGVWAQFRSLLAKRKIKFHGMRVAEPHHDATPHWHILFFIKADDRAEVVRLFKQKALELNGEEKGAKTHRARVDDCDGEKGTPTGYFVKYISKNMRGSSGKNGESDEIDGFSLDDNAISATAWARLWGIRQFQFFGVSSIAVWRELRRLIEGDIKDKLLEDLRICTDMGEFAAYLERQGGASATRKDQLAVLAYEEVGENRYGATTKRIIGIKDNRTGEIIITRKKKWVIKKRPADFIPIAERSEAQTGGLARPWTCVSNCNRSENKQILKDELIKVMGTVNDHQFKYFLTGKKLFLTYDRYVRLKDGRILIEKPAPKRYDTASDESSRLQRLRDVGRQLHS